jgi:hypothetical protein
MRIKVSSEPPFPPIRAWLLLASDIKTVGDLKRQLVKQVIKHLPANATAKSKDIVLSVDGFDLLEKTDVSMLKEDVDVVR